MKTAFEKIASAGLSLVALTVLMGSLDGVSHMALAAGITPPSAPNFPPMAAPPTNLPPSANFNPSMAVSAAPPAALPMVSPSMAQPPAAPSPTPMTSTGNSGMPIMPAPVATNATNANPDDENADSGAKGQDTTKEDKIKSDKKLTVLENKVSDSVKDVVKHLGSSAEEVTLDDLNSARQAVAKLEALIDIEKHLADLDKVRNERENAGNDGNSGGLASKIPQSALRPLPMQMSSFPPMNNTPQPPPVPTLMPVSSIEVTKIIGSDGRFTAIMKTPDGQSKPVHIGDKLTDGSTITGITSKGVVIDQNGTKHVIQVKNVGEVFGNNL